MSAAAAPAARANVVLILADDLGWADLQCYGSTFHETPQLDRLARSGVRFTAGYAAASVCSPTRAAILTGKSPARLHLTDWLKGRPDRPDQKLNRPNFQMHLPLEEVTLAEALKEAGYRTASLGKWHLGESPAHWPEHQGFDLNLSGCGKGHPPSYFSPYEITNLPDGPKGEYLTDRLTREAVKFIEQNRAQTFFLYLPHYAVHTPLQARPDLIAKYQAIAASLTNAGVEFTPDSGRNVRQVQNHPTYAAMLESLDESVGRILDKLEELSLMTNTIVIFTSDNGGLSTAEGSPTSNIPLRTGKGWPYEGGVRVPLLIAWPSQIAAARVSPVPVTSADLYPTLLELLNLPPRPEQTSDGRSVAPLLRGGNIADRPLFWHYPHYSNQGGAPNGAIRLGCYKLIEWYEDMRVELFDLEKDPSERNDISKTEPAVTARLRQRLHEWRRESGAQMPTPNPDYRPAKGGE